MTMRRNFLVALAASIALIFTTSGAAIADDVIAKFNGTSKGTAGGHAAMMVDVTVMSTNKLMHIPIPNEDPKNPGVPKKDIDDSIKKLTAGEYVKVAVEPNKDMGGIQALSSIDAYEIKPGEDTPNGYVFSKTVDKTVGKNTVTSIILTKFGVEHSFTIATHKGDSGPEPDPDVVAAVAKLTAGNGVWVQFQGKTIITAIDPYTDPQTGKVGKIAETDVDDHKVKSAEIETDDGKTITVMVPVKESGTKFVPDSVILGQLNKVKTGTQVAFRVHEDGDKLWLREIEAVKPTPK